ncbi:MAG: hypothetical protein M1819_000902 [Sarea resinae]|nr:MAG: hypothetical protein M1819_000902 [Sarea resinae]
MANNYLQDRVATPPVDRLDSSSPLSTPLTPSGGAAPRSNALSSKLSSVLSTSYADLEIRDALETLDARGIESTPTARRQLRLDVQKEVLQCNGEIIREFGQIANQLKRIGTTIESLNQCCVDMRQHISAAHLETRPVLEEASSLISQKQQVETKQRLLDAFNTHFVISDDDLTTLTSTAEPVNDQFFTVLNRVKRIQKDTQVLLGAENQRLGLEILDQSSKALNGAFQKLYRWVQKEFKSLNLENPQIGSSIRRSLRVLAERPTLFQNCLDFFSEARENVLADAFYTALTGNSQGERVSNAKPIELVAHDPLRYVGDMLAWTHSAAVSEREALEVLFVSEGDEIAKGIQAGREDQPWTRGAEEEEVFDGQKALNQLVSRDITGVARLLRQRTEQVIQSQEEPTMAYKIANLLNFYRVMFSKLLSEQSDVLATLAASEETALRQFRATMKDRVTSFQVELVQTPADLNAPAFLSQALEELKALMKSYDSSLSPASSREAEFQPILAEALDPFLEGCDKLAKGLKQPANAIFSINCLSAAITTLSSATFTTEKLAELEDTMEEQARKLVEYQHNYFLRSSGLQPLVEVLASLSDTEEDIVSIPTLGPFQHQSLLVTSQTLDDFLPSAIIDANENLKQLSNSKLAKDVSGMAADQFCEDFEMLEGKLLAADELTGSAAGRQVGENEEDEEGIVTLRSLFPRTTGEIRVLLS